MKALVLSGGGCKGAFQLGVLKKLQEEDPELDYDIYTGISVGALNSSLLATGPLKETLSELERVWMNDIKGNSSVRTHRLLMFIIIIAVCILAHVVAGFALLFFALPKWISITFLGVAILNIAAMVVVPMLKCVKFNRSIYSTKPLRNIINKRLDVERLNMSGKKLRVGAVSFQTGEYRTGNEKSDDIKDWIMASSAFPIFFPMPEIDGYNWTDGGVRETAPLRDAVELGATEIDVILTSPLNVGRVKDTRLLPQISRVLELITAEIMANDVYYDECVHEKGIKIRIIAPKEHFEYDTLSFIPSQIRFMYNAEYEIVKESIDIL